MLPSIVLFIFSFYIGVQLWSYGTYYSLILHANVFNPWIWMVVGSFGFFLGHAMPRKIFLLTSNAGEVFLLICIVRMFREVHHDLLQVLEHSLI